MIKFLKEWNRVRQIRPYNQSTWRTQDGRMLKVIDMSDGHLRNAIFYLQRRHMEILWDQYRIDLEFYDPTDDDTIIPMRPSAMNQDPGTRFPIYYDMLREADRRKLKWSVTP